MLSPSRFTSAYTAELLVHGRSHLEVEIAIANLKKYKSLGSEQIPAELIQLLIAVCIPQTH
jgi:hypothetical protein